MGVVLHVRSKTTSFQDFIKDTKLPVYMSHEKGQQRFKTMPDKPPFDDYGISCNVSEKEWDDLDGQIEDAIDFLEKYKEQLEFLNENFSVYDIRLDFPYYCRIFNKFRVQCDYLPPELLCKAGKLGIGIELSLYPPIKDEGFFSKFIRLFKKTGANQ